MSLVYDDGWTRTFRQVDIPKFDPKELKMLKSWIRFGHIVKCEIYLCSPKYHNLDENMAAFVIRELVRGNL